MIGHITLKGVGMFVVPEQIAAVSGLCLVFINIIFNIMYFLTTCSLPSVMPDAQEIKGNGLSLKEFIVWKGGGRVEELVG